MNAPKTIRHLTEAVDIKRWTANLRARRGPDDPVMAALDRGDLPPANWNEAPQDPSDIASELKSLVDADQNYDAYTYLYQAGRFDCIHLDQIRVRKDAPPGTGTRFMKRLCEIADRHGWWITLSPGQGGDGDAKSVWKRTTSQARLMRWYSGLGFRRNASKGLFQLRGAMHRRPAPPSVNPS